MKNIYWNKVDVWCKYPFQHEIDYRYIEFYTTVKASYKTKLPFTCDSSVVNQERVNFVAEKLGINPSKINLISIKAHNKKKFKTKNNGK